MTNLFNTTSIFFLNFFLLSVLSLRASAKNNCVKVVGRIHCATDWDRHFDVPVWLMDKDPLPWENDDYMGKTRTDEDGNFHVEGCANDFGSWNDPDPYLMIEHRCPEPGHTVSIPRRRKIVMVEPIYEPDVVYVETIRIDDDEKTN